jgi:hypothetical protein
MKLKRLAGIAALASGAYVLGVFLFYLIWTVPDQQSIEGVQGRYLVVVLLFYGARHGNPSEGASQRQGALRAAVAHRNHLKLRAVIEHRRHRLPGPRVSSPTVTMSSYRRADEIQQRREVLRPRIPMRKLRPSNNYTEPIPLYIICQFSPPLS